MQTTRSDIHLALALFCLLTCLYWLTDGAHTYIHDGETMYLVTEGLVERGSFAQLEREQAGTAPRSLTRGRDGRLFAVTGPLQSLLAVPFYAVGRWAAQAFPPPFYSYFTRFFVCLFNSPVHAATVALLYLFGVDLGYRRRTALFVALTYGLATAAWPYARTFFGETLLAFWLVLAAWAVYRFTHTENWFWMALTGAAIGLGIATKYVMAVAGPAFALYLLLEFWRRNGKRVRWRWAGHTLLTGAIPLVFILGTLMCFNYARFGGPLETGYTKNDTRGSVDVWVAKATPLLSLYSLLFSSGKGFFFFSPPVVLSLWGIPVLARHRRNETWLFLTIAISYPVFYSLVTYRWFGGANWGPRYIVCITPFLVLPLCAFLERSDWARWWRIGAVTVLFIIGFWVQVSTIVVDYNSYVFSTVRSERQLFHPAHSALSAHWRLWLRQVKAWQQYDHDLRMSGEQFYIIDGGFYQVEVPDLAPFGRWMRERGRLRIYAQPEQALTIQITYSRSRQVDAEAADWSGLSLAYDGVPVASERRLIAERGHETQWIETLTIAADDVHILPGTLEMTATTWIPQEFNDSRGVSVFVGHIDVSSNHKALAVSEVKLPRPMPVSTAYPWSWEAMRWFYDPINARPFDMWPWHVWTSGIPLQQARIFIFVLISIFGGGLVASTGWFILVIKRNL